MADDSSTLPSEKEIEPVLQNLLKTKDLDQMTLRTMMGALAEHFGVDAKDLAVRKKYVRSRVEDFLETQYQPDVEDTNVKKRKRAAGSSSGSKNAVVLSNLEKAVALAEPLSSFLGVEVVPRPHVAKRIIEYAKEKGLQDPSDKRRIKCDEGLKNLLGVDEFTQFSIHKYLTPFIRKEADISDERLLELCRQVNEQHLAEKQDRVAKGEGPKGRSMKRAKDAATATSRRGPGGASGFQCEYRLSPQLAEVCGGEVMSRQECVKKLWVYIRSNQLNSGGKIRLDDKLKVICEGEEEVSNFGINKYLKPHLTKLDKS